ncbi:nitroreductase [Pseudothauera rhizosphaerae]|uniref:Nitroreductase n=1 Tax=Pseudothauera rhizosphaerae TaxID=2565932 RepID=A0A4S4AIS1_9RHOO|nr:nitroreductase [Pseudothauera rhizosphaerae]THF59266.1 nitroreductase [Pseudothauera rhizosphaerae]
MNATDRFTDAEVFDRIAAGRRSIRAFLPREVDERVLDDILRVAARAPSGNDIQPWRVHVLRGDTLRRLVEAVCAAFDGADGNGADGSHRPEYAYYPAEFFEPYLGRRRKLGWELYRLLGIARGDTERMRAQVRRNFDFFGAPVGLMFTIDRRLAQGSWLDYGMFLQTLMLAAEARGLATCAQAAWIDYHRIIEETLALPAHEQVVCGIALGHADPDAAENGLVSERAALDEFVVKHS